MNQVLERVYLIYGGGFLLYGGVLFGWWRLYRRRLAQLRAQGMVVDDVARDD